MFSKKLTTSILALTMAMGLLLTGCGRGDSIFNGNAMENEEEVQITFWDDNAGPQRTPIWEELIERFEKQNPQIDVVYVGLNKDSAKSKLDAAIAANNTPDVASIYTSWLPEFAEREALLPLDYYFDLWSEKNMILEKEIDFNRTIVKDQKLYGIPYTQNLDVLWIRKDWFEEEEVKAPETWDDFFHAVETLTDESKDRYGYSIRGGVGGSFQLQRMMYAYSGIQDYIKDGKSTINDPKHIEFLKRYFALYQNYTPKGDVANNYRTMLAGFDTGKIAMIQHNLGSYGEHRDFLKPHQYQAIPLPKSIEGVHVAEGGNTIGLSIFQETDHPNEAWKLVRFLNSAEAQSYWNKTVGQLPTNTSVLSEKWLLEAPHAQMAAKVYDDPETIFIEPAFYLPEYRSILNSMVDSSIQKVLSGEMTVEDLLAEWANAVEEAHKRYTKDR
ncbi:ABC transporter substrate-binding protein [Mesobacillus maritimus]|uniref:ABC transporter substrate-binding protein n=1 Tax=Mesobacillus maritimus TaxID=1643336 RepID=UPI00384E4FCA